MTETETIFIPLVDPELEIVECYPTKIVFSEKYVEFYDKYTAMMADENTGIKKETDVDTVESIIKSSIGGIVAGKEIHNEGIYLFRINYLDRSQTVFFKTKQESRDLYSKFNAWLFDAP